MSTPSSSLDRPPPSVPDRSSVILPGDSPFNEALLSHLFTRRYETADVDFKETVETSRGSAFPKVAKHFFGMANYGGGFLLVGFRHKPTGGYEPLGLPTSFHIDQAELQGKFNALSSLPLAIGYREFDREVGGVSGRFAVVYVPPAPEVLTPVADGEFVDSHQKHRFAYRKGDVLIRRGTSTEKATPLEIDGIKARARTTAYHISLISGQPDILDETLVSNVFLALKLPPRVYACQVDLRGRVPEHGLASCLFRGGSLYSFEDPSKSGLVRSSRRGSRYSEPIQTWRADPDKSRLLTQILESAAVRKGCRIGLLYDEARARFYFPLENGSDRREESWPGISRPTVRQVAVRKYLSSLKREICIHSSVQVGFQWMGDDLGLRLEPGYLLTDDGRRPLHGPKQGNVLIGIESWLSSFNGGYLRNVLFWRSKFQGEDPSIALAPELEFDSRPLSVRVPVGIREDTIRALETVEPPSEGKEVDGDG